MKICEYCGNEFKNLQNHQKHCKKNPHYDEYDHSYLSKNGTKTFNEIVAKRRILKKENTHIYKFVCERCGKEFEITMTESTYNKGKYRRYCSRSCSNSSPMSDETKKKISKTLSTDKVRTCCICGKTYRPTSFSKFCSDECKHEGVILRYKTLSRSTIEKLSEAGRKSVEIQSEIRRSKNEILFCKLCEEKFKSVAHNSPIFNGWDADIIINDIKVAVLWNGIWHHKKIRHNHSVDAVKNRDSIKEKEIIKCGYIPYVIDDMGKYNKKFVYAAFDEFIKYVENNVSK